MKSKVYFENLDSLRFLAALAVVCSHICAWLPFPDNNLSHWFKIIFTIDGSGGQAGVRFFFCLSGFLITYLLLEEYQQTGTTDVPKFYLRRILRIWPLYYLTLLIGFIVFPMLSSYPLVENANGLMYSVFLANFDNAFNGLPTSGILGVQWSVAIEEQFYLIWPLLFFFFKGKSSFPLMMLLLIGVSTFYNFLRSEQFHTLSCMGDLAVGGLAAYYSFYHEEKIRALFSFLTKGITFFIYAAGILLLFSTWQVTQHFLWSDFILHVFFNLFFTFVILEQCFSEQSFLKMGAIKIFTAWGKISYGIYLLHMIVIYLILKISDFIAIPLVLEIILVLPLTVLLSHVSYYYFELYFLKLKARFAVLN